MATKLNSNNPSEFEDSLAQNQSEVGFADDQNEQQAQEYYQRMAAEENRQRRAVALKQEITRQIGKRVGQQALKTGGRSLFIAIWPYLLIGAAVIIAIFMFFAIFALMIYAMCDNSSPGAGLVRSALNVSQKVEGIPVIGSLWKNYVIDVPLEVCAEISGTSTIAGNRTQAVTPNGQPPVIQPPSGDGAPANNISDAAARQRLASAFIQVNKACVDETRVIGGAGQTCLGRTKLSTINEIIRLKQACDVWAAANNRSPEGASYANAPAESSFCYVYVTGGSEPGHAQGACSHSSGYKIDLSVQRNINLRAFIEYEAAAAGTRGGDPRWVNATTNSEYVLELSAAADHWDITVNCG